MPTSNDTLGYCGLYCGGCGVWQATQKGAPLKDDAGNPMLCDGCASGRVSSWCSQCALKDCARERGFRYCLECPDNPCDKLTGFMNDPAYPYHLKVQDFMKNLRERGLEDWTRHMEAHYKCAGCGGTVNFAESACTSCGAKLNT